MSNRDDFKTDRKLLNYNFQGYKLSHQPLDVLERELTHPVRLVELKDDGFSYQRMKAYALHNHLHFDPSDPNSVYWFGDDGHVMKGTLHADSSISSQNVLCCPVLNEDCKTVINPTIVFLDNNMGVVCIGDSSAYLFSREIQCTPNSELTRENWSIVASFPVGDGRSPVMATAAGSLSADILLAVLSEEGSNDPIALYKWFRITFKTSLTSSRCVKTTEDVDSISTACQFKSKSLALYSDFQYQSSSMGIELLFMSETTPLIDSGVRVEENEAVINVKRGSDLSEEPDGHRGLGYKREEEHFEWTQSDTDIVITVELPQDVGKRDIICRMGRNEVGIGLTDGTTFVRGRLSHDIDKDASTWSFHRDGERNKLEVTLEKYVEGVAWKYLMEDNVGSKVTGHLRQDDDEISAEEMEELKKKFIECTDATGDAEMTTTTTTTTTLPMVEAMVEECDKSEENVTMFIISEKGELKQKVSLGGRQLVFTSPCRGGQSHYFSLRHEVDAVVWLPPASLDDLRPRWDHVATFNALGYVQASKTERKFTLCSPDAKFAVISDSRRHVFVYLQPHGSCLDSAVEYVHSMPKTTDILGVTASNSGSIFVLTRNELVILKIPHTP